VECSLGPQILSQFLKDNGHVACYTYCTDKIVESVHRLPQLHRRHRDGKRQCVTLLPAYLCFPPPHPYLWGHFHRNHDLLTCLSIHHYFWLLARTGYLDLFGQGRSSVSLYADLLLRPSSIRARN
jgi:hypothetical protein